MNLRILRAKMAVTAGSNPAKRALRAFESWYSGLTRYKMNNNFPAKGTMGAALHVLDRLKKTYDLNLPTHLAPKGTQIAGYGGPSVKRLLAEFSETRQFLAEGRTNRGVVDDVRALLEALRPLKLERLEETERNEILQLLQERMVEEVRAFHSHERLKVEYDRSKSTWQSVHDLLALATEVGKEGPVAQHLVGAKLQLRYPKISVENRSYSTADEQSRLSGDYRIGDTVFHITVAPNPGHFDKCVRNLRQNLRVYLVVPERLVIGSKQLAEQREPGRISVQSVESFVAQNLDEITEFSAGRVVDGFRRLLRTYNERVDQVEPDKSMLIDIPENM